MIAIGQDELDSLPELGKIVVCWICGKEHPVEHGNEVLPDGTKKPDTTLGFFKCDGKSYLCGIGGKEFRPKGE